MMSLHTELALELKDQVIADLKQALAEKDREIEVRETELGKLDAELIIRNAAYQQLMEKAIGLAKILMGASSEAEQYMTGEQFLQSPEVQAWKEHQS